MTRRTRRRGRSLGRASRTTAVSITTAAFLVALFSGCSPTPPATPLGDAFVQALEAASVPGGAIAVRRQLADDGILELDATAPTAGTGSPRRRSRSWSTRQVPTPTFLRTCSSSCRN